MFVSRLDTVSLKVTAVDDNIDGEIVKYYWDKGLDGWDDSTSVPEYNFYSEILTLLCAFNRDLNYFSRP